MTHEERVATTKAEVESRQNAVATAEAYLKRAEENLKESEEKLAQVESEAPPEASPHKHDESKSKPPTKGK